MRRRRCIGGACIWSDFSSFVGARGRSQSKFPELAARLFLESLPVGGSAQDFAREQARMALDVFIGEMVGWSWCEDRYGRVGPKFRLKTNSAGLTTEDTGGTESVLANDRVHGMESPWKSDSSASHPYPGVSLRAAAPRAERNQEALDAMRRALLHTCAESAGCRGAESAGCVGGKAFTLRD